MRSVKYLMLSLILTIIMPAVGFAKTRSQGTMTLVQPAMIGSTQLKAGIYKVQWDGIGPNVQVNIMKGKNTVATTPAELKTNDRAAFQDAVVLKTSGNQQQIAEIDFGKHKEALVITAD
jgi:hypothetical protein